MSDWADSRLQVDRLDGLPGLDPQQVADAWRRHRDGISNEHHFLWNVLTLQAWIARYRNQLD